METIDCLFCQIIAGEVNSYKVYEDEFSLAILDIFPISPGHVLVLPKKHCRTLAEMDETEAANVFRAVVKINKVLVDLTPNNDGFNILQNNGKGAGQEIEHVHFHIIPRFKDDHVRFKFPKYNLPAAQMKFVQEKLLAVLK
jgi:histidine triad (HIT) family protein